jgi:TonB-linked SusC/RagA family outer membrane protein
MKFKFKDQKLIIILLFFIGLLNPLLAQQGRSIRGSVTDSEDIPLPGVSVVVKGTTTGTLTNTDGKFALNVPTEANTLVFSFVGMKTVELSLDGRSIVEIKMEEESVYLQEVVAIGYGTMRKADLTGAIATLSADQVEKNSYANVLQGIQGRIPGVYITADGSPVGNTNIQIRGLTSLRSAPPLIIIDNLPTTTNLRDINPNDIASIQVLKDAASASIYGSRAASGVIIIETKSAKQGESRITYNGKFGISSFMNRIKMMNTEQYGRALWQAAINDGRDPNLVTQIYDYDWGYSNGKPVLNKIAPVEWLNPQKTQRSADTDWMEAGSQLGLQSDQQLSIFNGTDKLKSLLSLNYYENQGTQIHTMFRRFTLRLNNEYKLINNRLTIGENISLGNIKMNNQNVMHSMFTLPSIIPVYAEDGSWGGTAYSLGMDDYNNPVRMLTLGKDNYEYFDKLIGSMYATIHISKDIDIKTLYGIDYTTGRFRHINFKWIEAGGKLNPNNGINTYRSNNLTTTWSNTLTYKFERDKHRFDALGGIEYVHYNFEDIRGYRWDIEIEDYDYGFLNAATGNQEVYGGGDEWALLSYFSKFNYVYDDKYLLSATLRYDGSSKFGANNRFGFFPAISAGWRLSQEPFLKDVTTIYDLKFRVSWGMNGNSNIPTNALLNFYDANYYQTAYGLGGKETGLQSSGYRKVHTGNPDLKWEATQQYNAGLDFGLYEGSLTGSFDYFQKFTKGMLYEPPYIGAIGEGGYRWINAADMSNKGFELILTYHGKTDRNFSYSITGNLSSFKNKIENLPETARYAYGGNGLDDDILGRPLNSIYGFIADGIFKTQEEVDISPEQSGKSIGRIRFKDLDNDGRITWQHDRTWIGCSDPDLMYGLNFDAKYKNFDFNMFWQGVLGNEVRNDWKSYSDFWAVWTQQGFNHPTRLLNAWNPDNIDSTIPALSMQNPNDERRVSTYFVESGAYLKLRHLEIGYTFPIQLISKVGLKQCRINLAGINLINIKKWWGDNAYTSVDPENPTKEGEYSAPYVRPQIFTVGIDLTF